MNTELTQLMMKLRHVLHLMKQEELPPPPFNASTLCDLCANACGFWFPSPFGECKGVINDIGTMMFEDQVSVPFRGI